jgi:hypothetical protein
MTTGCAMLSCRAVAWSRPMTSGSAATSHRMVPGMTTPGSEIGPLGAACCARLAMVATSTSTTLPCPFQIEPAASASRTRPSVERSSARSTSDAGAVTSMVAIATSRPSTA